MALSVAWSTKVINVLQADLTALGGGVYELDTDQFRKDLNALQANVDGIVFDTTHEHTAPKTLAGTTFARFIEIINGYTIDFEDTGSPYQVNLVGSNNNILDVKTVNNVSLAVQNSAGLIQVSSGSGLSAEQDSTLTAINAELQGIEGIHGHSNLMRGMWAMLAGHISGAEVGQSGTATISDMANTKTRITMDFDAHGNRLSVTFNDLT